MSRVKWIVVVVSVPVLVVASAYGADGKGETNMTGGPGYSSSAPAPAPAPSPPASSSDRAAPSSATTSNQTPEGNSVESFFQIDPANRNSAQNLLMQSATVTAPTTDKRKTVPHYFYRGLWHLLDNAGVPMFFGHDSYLDPSIRETYHIDSPKLPSERAVERDPEKAVASPSKPAAPQKPATTQSAPQKIPASELEGVPLPAPRDDVVH